MTEARPDLKPFIDFLTNSLAENAASLAMREFVSIRVRDEDVALYGYVRVMSAINMVMDKGTSISRFAWSVRNLASKTKDESLGRQLVEWVIDTTVLNGQIQAQKNLAEFHELTKDLNGAALSPQALEDEVAYNNFFSKCCNQMAEELPAVATLMLRAAQRQAVRPLCIYIGDEDLLKFGYKVVEETINKVMKGSSLPEGCWSIADPKDYRVQGMTFGVQLVEWRINTAVFKSDYTKT